MGVTVVTLAGWCGVNGRENGVGVAISLSPPRSLRYTPSSRHRLPGIFCRKNVHNYSGKKIKICCGGRRDFRAGPGKAWCGARCRRGGRRVNHARPSVSLYGFTDVTLQETRVASHP
ncbi:hypothetical protein E2C01_069903 [Portunus trituberculatus]|uniref:Uncharacterized protein n=1 Tax=Portunus trituberculatus TaxID=210409 RepID=A0A5B7HZT5_PORTR|nr:hypothetical protein [Portunus trituberculatus]